MVRVTSLTLNTVKHRSERQQDAHGHTMAALVA